MASSGSRAGQIAVIFAAQHTGADEAGYATAAGAMVARAGQLPGYRGMHSTRGTDGFGITVSYWTDEASALAWRDDPEHARIRDLGRARWYESYELIASTVIRDYGWRR